MDKVVLLLSILVSVNGCKYMRDSGKVCIVEKLSQNDLISGSVNIKVQSLICIDCYFNVDDGFVVKLWIKYPKLTTLVMTFDSFDACINYATLITVRGCVAGKLTPLNIKVFKY